MKMRKFFFAIIAVFLFAGMAFAAPNAAELKKMSTFLSNFTELGFLNVTASHIARPSRYADAVFFGVWHNYVNNYHATIAQCPIENCQYGGLTIKASDAERSVKRYFGVSVKMNKSADHVGQLFHYANSRFHFEGADGDTTYYAKITKLEINSDNANIYTARGIIFNANEPSEIYGDFVAHFKSQVWQGKKAYVLIDIRTKQR
jgi:hypothetical protein